MITPQNSVCGLHQGQIGNDLTYLCTYLILFMAFIILKTFHNKKLISNHKTLASNKNQNINHINTLN